LYALSSHREQDNKKTLHLDPLGSNGALRGWEERPGQTDEAKRPTPVFLSESGLLRFKWIDSCHFSALFPATHESQIDGLILCKSSALASTVGRLRQA